jgi:acetyl esterase/lipase
MMKLVMAIPGLFLFSVCVLSVAFAQNSNQPTAQTPNQPEPIPLWANGAPGAKGDAPEDVPSVQLYQPPADKASGAAIVVCPGGGYGHLAQHEGHDIAVWLNGIGVTAVVLKYRLGPKYQHPSMMQDALRAIRYTRSKASEWKIDPNRVGVIGFSAGGHLASTAATQFNVGDPNASDPVEKLSSRPDLSILCYPVVTMTDPFAHKGSRRNLLGENPSGQLIDLMSSEKQVTDQTPPTFLFHTADDPVVPVENSLMFALALRKKKIPYELHVYEHGRHGVGLASDDPALNTWPRLLENWLRVRGFVKQSQRVSETTPAKRRNPELLRLIDELRATPPEFAADSMIRISSHPEIDGAWRAEILEEAFRIAFDAQHPYKLKHLSESQSENRTGYKGMAFDLKMDRQSLQLLAILNMLRLDPKKARLLWGEMQKQKLEPLKCEEALIYDVADYYRAMVEMARRAFTREEMRISEEIQFVEQHIVTIASPAELMEAASAIMDLQTTTAQFYALAETYSRALDNVANDNRSFWFYTDRLQSPALALAGVCERRGFPADFLLARYRDYMVKQLGAPRCADNLMSDGKPVLRPKFVTEFNAALDRYEYIPKIADDDAKPRYMDRAALIYPYWTTRRAKSLFDKIYVLRYGHVHKLSTRVKSTETPKPLPYETRQSSQWQYQLSDFLREMAEWKPEHEASADDYFHQKCRLFNEVLELAPNSSMRLRILGEYMAFLEQNRFERKSFIEWFLHVSDLLRRIRSMNVEEKNLSFEALLYSNDPVLQLCVKLMPVIAAALQASR